MPPALEAATPLPAPAAAERGRALRLVAWLVPFALLGAILVRLYPDGYQQDGGFHFLFARWSFEHPHYLVDVWGRPLFTILYALPARLGYPVAKLLTVAVALAAAWHTAQLAREHGLEHAELAVPLLFLQPSFLLLSCETMTEPLFALVLAIALRLHRSGRVREGMWTASLLPLARPEGFFLALLWGAFVALDPRAGRTFLRRAVATLRLAGGVGLWWLLALLITGDPRFILHNWPPNWAAGATYGTGPLLQYWAIRDQLLAGPVLQALFGVGLVTLVASRRALLPVACAVLVAALHSIFFRFGWFGSAGYARYLVCVAPPMALATLAGWNAVARRIRWAPRPARLAAGAALLLWAGWLSLQYVDRFGSSRDAWAVTDMHAWFMAHPRPVSRFVFSQAYMAIRFGRDPAERPRLGKDPDENVRLLRASPAGTLVCWDARTGRWFHDIGPDDLERAGYERLRAASFDLRPLLPHHPPLPPYQQEMWLYYKAQ